MTNGQFSFSFGAGIAVAALGGAILGKATVGFSLIALGAAITALALLTRNAQQKAAQPVPHLPKSAAEH